MPEDRQRGLDPPAPPPPPLVWWRRFRVCLPLLAATVVAAMAAQAPEETASFRIEPLADGVYAAVARPGAAAGANAAFIINTDDVVVVDTHMTPGAASELIEAIGRITPRPVRFVVNTHWHPDHTQGNQRYAGAFPPGVTFLSHAATREDVATLGARRLAADLERLPREIASLEARLARLAGTEEPQARKEVERLQDLLAELRSVELVLPSVTFDRTLTLYRGSREIQLLYFGRGHTRGDLVVYLPRERIALVGDLVTGGPPFARDGYPIAWAETLARLARLDLAIIVPGHGRVRHDASIVGDRERFLRQAVARVERGRAAGESVDEMSAAIELDSFRDTFDPEPEDRPWRGWMRMLVERTLAEQR